MGHGIVPERAGWGTFGWLIAVFLLVTMIFALSLQVIIGRFRRVGKTFDHIWKRETTRTPAAQARVAQLPKTQNLKDMLGMPTLGLRRRIHQEGKLEDLETGAAAE
jgi:hypothetical protein